MKITGPIPPHILKLMPKEERPDGVAGLTRVECDEKQNVTAEKKLHEVFEGWCRVTGLSYIHSRMDRKSTIAEFWPDFTILDGPYVVCVEFKKGDEKLTAGQEAIIGQLRERGTPVFVSNDAGEAILWVKEQFTRMKESLKIVNIYPPI